jgi:hypothetical protein
MGFLDKWFGSKKQVTVVPQSDARFQQAVAGSQQEIITAAEKKLGRSLTDAERQGVQRIHSLMMLESCCRAFASAATTQAEVLADLEYFAKKALTK